MTLRKQAPERVWLALNSLTRRLCSCITRYARVVFPTPGGPTRKTAGVVLFSNHWKMEFSMVGCRQTVVDSLAFAILVPLWVCSLDLRMDLLIPRRELAGYTGKDAHHIILPEVIAIAGGLYDTFPLQILALRVIA